MCSFIYWSSSLLLTLFPLISILYICICIGCDYTTIIFFLSGLGRIIPSKDARGVMVIVVGNGLGDTNSNPGRDWLHFT